MPHDLKINIPQGNKTKVTPISTPVGKFSLIKKLPSVPLFSKVILPYAYSKAIKSKNRRGPY